MVKKLLHLLFLLFVSTAFSQLVSLTIPNKTQCAGNSTFDLTSMNSVILAQNTLLNASSTFQYYLSYADAFSDTNPIANPSSFVCTGASQTIYVRTNSLVPPEGIGNFDIIVNSSVQLSALVTTPISCQSSGTITAIATGGTGNYTYYLIDMMGGIPNMISVTGVFTNLSEGIYEVKAKDASGCFSNTEQMVLSQVQNISCNAAVSGNQITISATGGASPYQYSINGAPFQASSIFTNVSPGTYSYVVRDINGCTCSNTVTVTNSNFNVSIGATLDNPTSTLFANVNGGVTPYSYQWQLNGTTIPSATGQTLNILGQCGVFSVKVTDATNQIAQASSTVNCGAPIANNDVFTISPDNLNTYTTTSVLTNDYFYSPGNTTLIPLVVPNGFLLNADGTISILPGTPSGIYTLTYRLASNPAVFDDATVTLNIVNKAIRLKAFLDLNNNSLFDTGEQEFYLCQFSYTLNNGPTNIVSPLLGEYLIIDAVSTNLYNVSCSINPQYAAYYALNVSNYTNISVPTSGISTYYFPVTALPYTNLSVYTIPSGAPPRPGFTYTNMISYRNSGNQPILSGSVSFIKDSSVSILNVSQAGITVNPDGFTYDFTNLQPNEMRSIYVTMQVPVIPTVSLGQILTNTVSATIPVAEITILDNTSSLSQVIVGSYDPNDKVESHGEKIVQATFTSNDYLTYTIQFENTGTANAVNVNIKDILDSQLDETTIKMVASSHPVFMHRSGNTLNWHFNQIQLAPNGKGFVVFQIKPKAGYAVGDVIPNKAEIYFDFNPAIITNTVTTTFVSQLQISEFQDSEFQVYPNPAKDKIAIVSSQNKVLIESVSLWNVLGEEVLNQSIQGYASEVNISQLPNGFYFLKIKSDGKEQRIKILKN